MYASARLRVLLSAALSSILTPIARPNMSKSVVK